jgi:hypothetical protein
MKYRQYESGKHICSKGETAAEMYIIMSGEVEIVAQLGDGKTFLLERLYRGSVLNHNSFLMDDGIDTDAVCSKPVSCYVIHVDDVDKLRKKHAQCEQVLHDQEMKLVNPKRAEPALDYILKDPLGNRYFYRDRMDKSAGQHKSVKIGEQADPGKHNYEKETRTVGLNFKLKNAILYHLLQLQEERAKPSMEELIRKLQK